MDGARRRQLIFTALYVFAAIVLLTLFRARNEGAGESREVPYSELLSEIHAGRVGEVQIQTDRIVGVLLAVPADSTKPPVRLIADRLPDIEETTLVAELTERGIPFSGQSRTGVPWRDVLLAWFPFILLISLYVFGLRRFARSGGPLSFAKTTAKVYDRSGAERVTFDDVAGVDEAEAELEEVVSFLRDPGRYRSLGARIPKGVLLVGPPGTGKTLLARAVAGEADVPFFSLSGSEFVEMFVGVGAARIRSLFEQARLRAPCIIFIDELDAIGRTRAGATAFAAHEEREQTLNQLLAEMDGFDPGLGVIIMSATNRPEVLDPALLRAGRFDRQIVVDRPDLQGRRAILDVHARRLVLEPGIDLDVVAQRTVGMTGADLANVVNEAALAGGRRGASAVSRDDFEEAIDRIQLGLKRRGRGMSEREKQRVAHHEAGHALVALSVAHADPVHRVTIIPRTVGSLGATLQLPAEDRYLVTRGELLDQLCVMLAGRAAEEVALDDISTGSHNDLERATETARQMVARFGMTELLGPVTYGQPVGTRFLETPVLLGEQRNYSEETARLIDDEVRRLIDEQHDRARGILVARRAVLDRIVRVLLAKETIERAELESLTQGDEFHETGAVVPRTGDPVATERAAGLRTA